jgi:hypothetical protein
MPLMSDIRGNEGKEGKSVGSPEALSLSYSVIDGFVGGFL